MLAPIIPMLQHQDLSKFISSQFLSLPFLFLLQDDPAMNWSLQIQRVSPEDAGRYECQATTYPPQSIVIRLQVVGAYTTLKNTITRQSLL